MRRRRSTAGSSRDLAALLRDRKEELIRMWTRRVLEDPRVPEASRLSEPSLRNRIPDLLDGLINALDRPRDEAEGPTLDVCRVAREHAQQRSSLGYGLVEELRELSHFRAAVLDLCAAEGMLLRGDAVGLLDAAIDESMITGAREMAREVHKALARRAALIDESHDAVLSWPIGGTIASWSRGAQELYGWSRSEALGRDPHELLQTEHPAGIREVERIVAREGRWEGELRHTTRDGRNVVVETRLVVVEDDDGQPLVLEANRDVTERRRAEEARREGEARLRAIVESAVDGIVTISESGIIESFNPAATRIFGYGAEEVVGRNVGVLMPEPYRGEHDRYLARYRETGERRIIGIGREVSGRHKDGTIFPIDLAVSETRLGDRRVFTGTIRNIGERKRVEKEREQLLESERAARVEAERAAHLRDEFVATVSHELRTPLNAILGWTGMLRSGNLAAASAEKALEVIERNARAQAALVEDLLDMSRIGSGKLRLDVREVDLGAIVENTVASHMPDAQKKRLAVDKALDTRGCLVRGDPGRLEQIVSNLLSNAIKFTPPGGRVRVLLRRAGSRAELVVRDTGQGIHADFLPHVFDRFRQAEASLTRKHRGLGLGLSLVKFLVEQHGGEIRAESEGEGKGATFTVTLPIATVRQQEEGEPVSPIEACASLAGIKALVVDDEEDARVLLQRILEQCEVEVIAVGSAAATLEQLPCFRPDVLISDIGMPELDGYQLIRAVRALDPQQGGRTPAVALTAFARPEDHLRALEAGYQMHLTKPVAQSEFLVVIANVTGRLERQRGGGGTNGSTSSAR